MTDKRMLQRFCEQAGFTKLPWNDPELMALFLTVWPEFEAVDRELESVWWSGDSAKKIRHLKNEVKSLEDLESYLRSEIARLEKK